MELKPSQVSTTQGRVAELGHEPDVDHSRSEEVIRLHFRSESDLRKGDLKAFLEEILAGESNSGQRSLL